MIMKTLTAAWFTLYGGAQAEGVGSEPTLGQQESDRTQEQREHKGINQTRFLNQTR